MNEERIEIVEDSVETIVYDTIKRDVINKAEVEDAKARVEILKNEIAERNIEIEKLEAKIALAEKVMEIARVKAEEARVAAEGEQLEIAIPETVQENTEPTEVL